MKKLLLFTFVALLCPVALLAQKKTPVKKTATPEPIVLKTSADSVSYALGAVMVKSGLQPYIVQMGVIADTAAVRSDYKSKIESEADAAKKEKLSKEMNFKIDSLNKANKVNVEDFLTGFNQALNQSKDKNAFNIGIALGSQISSMSANFTKELFESEDQFNRGAFSAGFAGILKDEKMLFEDYEEMMQAASEKAREAAEIKKSEGLKEQYAAQIAEGDAFMAENKTKDGVVTLPSGLQYKVVKEGTGAKPTASDQVKVHYVGTLINGEQFDSSVERGEPAVFGVSQVIKGWTEVLQLMPVGSKWMIYVPYDLAYGSRDTGTIKPYSNLIFEIELLDIEE